MNFKITQNPHLLILNFIKKTLFNKICMQHIITFLILLSSQVNGEDAIEKYQNEKKIIEPYFDEKYYVENYKMDLDKTGLSPIDHFMQYGWQGNYKTHRNPNSWFKVTLYKDRLWPCEGNPFFDYLMQPKGRYNENSPTVEIYIKNNQELYRGWMATEAFLRSGTFKPIVRLSPACFQKIPQCFVPMVQRGAKVLISNTQNLSFYVSPFILNPRAYDIDIDKEISVRKPNAPICTYAKKVYMHQIREKKFFYIRHILPFYSNYINEGRINPLVINIASHEEEPLIYCGFAKNKSEYREFLNAIADGYDLIFTNIKLNVINERFIPGFFVGEWDNIDEVTVVNKPFQLGFLLSLGSFGDKNFKNNNNNTYAMRLKLWERENEIINIPRAFYVSNRNANDFTEKYQTRKMPDDSKKWILNSQFAVSIENSQQDNYMTEKLISCFMTLTVPIYWGCPNVTDFFDARGMLIAESVDDIVRIANSLTPEKYAEMLPYLIKNKEKAIEILNLRHFYFNEFFIHNIINEQSKIG